MPSSCCPNSAPYLLWVCWQAGMTDYVGVSLYSCLTAYRYNSNEPKMWCKNCVGRMQQRHLVNWGGHQRQGWVWLPSLPCVFGCYYSSFVHGKEGCGAREIIAKWKIAGLLFAAEKAHTYRQFIQGKE
eukprot:1161643-Pelagomonas_calceolata.AAC.1